MVLGLDLSSVNSGYSILDNLSLIAFGSIKPPASASHDEKLLFIYNAINILFNTYQITEVAIEDQHFAKNISTLKLLVRISGVAMLCAQQHRAITALYPATTIKLNFTGNGKADKKMMVARAIDIYNLEKGQIDDNIADAIATSYTHIVKTTNRGGP